MYVHVFKIQETTSVARYHSPGSILSSFFLFLKAGYLTGPNRIGWLAVNLRDLLTPLPQTWDYTCIPPGLAFSACVLGSKQQVLYQLSLPPTSVHGFHLSS